LRQKRLVGELCELGLEEELGAYYKDVRKRLPTARLDAVID
jgi:hypothetical protein